MIVFAIYVYMSLRHQTKQTHEISLPMLAKQPSLGLPVGDVQNEHSPPHKGRCQKCHLAVKAISNQYTDLFSALEISKGTSRKKKHLKLLFQWATFIQHKLCMPCVFVQLCFYRLHFRNIKHDRKSCSVLVNERTKRLKVNCSRSLRCQFYL